MSYHCNFTHKCAEMFDPKAVRTRRAMKSLIEKETMR